MTVAATIHRRILDTLALCLCSAVIYSVSLISSGRVSLALDSEFTLTMFGLGSALCSTWIISSLAFSGVLKFIPVE